MVLALHTASHSHTHTNWFFTWCWVDRPTRVKKQTLLTACCWLRTLLHNKSLTSASSPTKPTSSHLSTLVALKNITHCCSPSIFLVLVFLLSYFMAKPQDGCRDSKTFDCLHATLLDQEFKIDLQFNPL